MYQHQSAPFWVSVAWQWILLKTLVKKYDSIGENATIVCGITIGEYALIGSGSVVNKDVPPYALVIGNPERVIGKVDKKGNRVE